MQKHKIDMKNTDKLISIYFYICECYNKQLGFHYQRMSNNYKPKFSDQEILTIFFYCFIVEKRKEIKDIYDFTDNYLRSWFPDLGNTYESYLIRLNNLYEVFPALTKMLIDKKLAQCNPEQFKIHEDVLISVVDSMPIILAKGNRSFTGKVAPNICDKGYCSTKKLHYYGLKLHVLGFSRFKQLPIPEYVGTSPASNNDLTVLKPIFEKLHDRAIFGDKIYGNKSFWEYLKKYNNLHIFTPVKKKKGQEYLEADDHIFSILVSKIRQPIEAFFGWIIDKTGIQNASKTRSTKGLKTHVFGKFAAALMIMTFDFL
jgi:hypothetical protein